MKPSGLKYAFTSVDDYVDEEMEYIKKLKQKKSGIVREAKSRKSEVDLSGDDRYEVGNAYFYARTGDRVDIDGVKYEISTDEDGNHRIGYSDELYLKDVETGETKKFSKDDFIAKARLLKEESENYGVWQNVDAKKYGGRELLGFVAKGLTKAEAEKKAKELTGKYGGFGVCSYEVRKVEDANEALVEEPVYDLSPVKSSQKSFYGKARVEVKDDGTKVLWSYNTPVCKIENGKATLLRRGYLGWASSPTTLKHVRDFLAQNGFEVGSRNELAKMYDTEFYESVNESIVANLNDEEEVKDAKELLTKEPEEHEEKIVDVDANTIDELKDSYVGNAILQCPVCRTLIYKKPDALVKEEDSDVFNKEEPCPHCGSEDGFELVGQVAEMSVEAEVEDDSTTGKDEVVPEDVVDSKVEDEVNVDEVDVKDEDEEEDELEFESFGFDEKSFDSLVTKFLNETYENTKGFSTKSVSFDGKSLIVEGEIAYKSGKVRTTSFSIAKGKDGVLEGRNATFSKDGDAFSFKYSLNESMMRFDSMEYRINCGSLEESYTIKGAVVAD